MVFRILIFRYDDLLNVTSIANVEESIKRHRRKHLARTPKTLTDLGNCLKEDNWKQLLQIDAENSLIVKGIIKNNDTKALIFIDKTLTEAIMNATNHEKLTIFVDGTFATVPQLNNNNCQLWTIIIRHNDRVSEAIYYFIN